MDSRVFLDECLKKMAEKNASDLHIKAGGQPRIRVSGDIKKMDMEPVDEDLLRDLANKMMNKHQKELFEQNRGVDLSFASETYGRFRANIFCQSNSLSMVIRVIKATIPPFENLHLPKVYEKIALLERGLILVAGATSSGKSTTVASVVEYINNQRECHVITLEDPIEYVYKDKKCLINQREIGQDARSFDQALKYVVRQDPDVIVVGEMRDAESLKSAITASETGHLVISTIHAKNVAQVLDRIVGFFPAEQREQILVQLSFNLQAITCQRLLSKAEGSGMVPASEILINNATIGKLIRDGKLDKLNQAMINGEEEGMQTFNQSLVKLYNDKLITKEEAMLASDNAQSLEMNLQGIFLDDSSSGILDR